jgi:hypothetical protein
VYSYTTPLWHIQKHGGRTRQQSLAVPKHRHKLVPNFASCFGAWLLQPSNSMRNCI